MNSKEKFIVLDTETTGTLESPIVYDIGYIVTNLKGEIFKTSHLIIKDIFNNNELMKSAYYANKIPKYLKELKENKATLVTFKQAKAILQNTIIEYDIKNLFAYNCKFDINSLNNTSQLLLNEKYFFNYGLNYNCIWNMSCQTICCQNTYIRECLKNGWLSDKGNLITNAEIVYKYITNDNDFKEEHQGLQDVIIENEILQKCYRQHKKMETKINPYCWKIPTSKYNKIKDTL